MNGRTSRVMGCLIRSVPDQVEPETAQTRGRNAAPHVEAELPTHVCTCWTTAISLVIPGPAAQWVIVGALRSRHFCGVSADCGTDCAPTTGTCCGLIPDTDVEALARAELSRFRSSIDQTLRAEDMLDQTRALFSSLPYCI